MSDIYDSTLHMRFANSILPDFRRKQDTASIQIEGVMNEILHLEQGIPIECERRASFKYLITTTN